MPDPNQAARDEILAACLDATARGDQHAIDRACRERPDLAEELRAAAAVLTEIRAALGGPARLPAIARRPDAIGRFRILGELGRGGMGVVFRAHDPELNREVAVKVLPDAMAASGRSVERFRREARALAQLKHRHIVAIHDVGQSGDGVPYFAMELVDGRSLAEILHRLGATDCDVLRAGDLLPAQAQGRDGSYVTAAVDLVAKIADALHAAHQEGLTHGDVKPGNILVDDQQEPHLVDFGIARDVDGTGASRSSRNFGTPAYMAPEQIELGGAIGPWTDVYGLGVTLYEALTLRRPFAGTTSQQTWRLVLEHEPARPRRLNPAIPKDVETICLTAMAKEPTRRYPSAMAMAVDLRNVLTLRPIAARRPGWLPRAGKWLRRNPWPVRLTIATGAALVAGALGVSLHSSRSMARAHQLVEAAASYMLDETLGTPVVRFTEARTRLLAALELRPDDDAAGDRLADTDEELTTMETERVVAAGLDRAQQLGDGPQARRELTALTATLLDRLNEQALRYPMVSRQGSRLGLLFQQVREARRRAHQPAIGPADAAARPSPASTAGSIQISGGITGARVFLFRYQPAIDGTPRLVPAPVRAGAATGEAMTATELQPGHAVLTVEHVAAGSLAAIAGLHVGDLILELGGQPVNAATPALLGRQLPPDGLALRIMANGVTRQVSLRGTGLARVTVLATSYPFACSPANNVGMLPDCTFAAEPGSYVALLRGPGHEDLRVPIHVDRAGRQLTIPVSMLPAGSSPDGFVRVVAGDFIAAGDPDAMRAGPAVVRFVEDFWIGRTEVTTQEYRAFLDDAQTKVAIERARSRGRSILVPRLRRGERESSLMHRLLWPETADGRFEPPPGWEPMHPVHAISCDDAVAYCQWRTRLAQSRGEPWLFRLPMADEWEKAARGVDARPYPWGPGFDRRLCMPREPVVPDQGPVAVMQVLGDESPWGVRDLGGGAFEWCAGVVPGTAEQVWRGGSWACREPQLFRSASLAGGMPWRVGTEDGFRVVAVPMPPEPGR